MKVYVDDMLVKSKFIKTLIDDLQEVFAILWKYQIKLNSKCAFRVPPESFLAS